MQDTAHAAKTFYTHDAAGQRVLQVTETRDGSLGGFVRAAREGAGRGVGARVLRRSVLCAVAWKVGVGGPGRRGGWESVSGGAVEPGGFEGGGRAVPLLAG